MPTRDAPLLQPLVFCDAAPVVRYEVDSAGTIIGVNDAWTTFAVANDALDLVAGRVIGRSVWEFVSEGRTRQLYRTLMRRVRAGARSRFLFRCDSPDRRRLMAMTMTAAPGGNVVFESATLRVERRGPPSIDYAQLAPRVLGVCDWCRRVQTAAGWSNVDVAPVIRRADGALPGASYAICPECYARVLRSIPPRRAIRDRARGALSDLSPVA